MRLHRTCAVKIMMGDKGSIVYRNGMIDKNNILSLVYRGGWWNVSAQRNGMRLDWYRKRKDARAYMEYMLEHAASKLDSMPMLYGNAVEFINLSGMRDVHFAARMAVSPSNTPGQGS